MPECLEQKYGGLKTNIDKNFFPPDVSMPGKHWMTMEKMQEECPEAIRYFAPWGQKKAEEELRQTQ